MLRGVLNRDGSGHSVGAGHEAEHDGGEVGAHADIGYGYLQRLVAVGVDEFVGFQRPEAVGLHGEGARSGFGRRPLGPRLASPMMPGDT